MVMLLMRGRAANSNVSCWWVQENIGVIAKYRARVAALRAELAAAGGGHDDDYDQQQPAAVSESPGVRCIAAARPQLPNRHLQNTAGPVGHLAYA